MGTAPPLKAEMPATVGTWRRKKRRTGEGAGEAPVSSQIWLLFACPPSDTMRDADLSVLARNLERQKVRSSGGIVTPPGTRLIFAESQTRPATDGLLNLPPKSERAVQKRRSDGRIAAPSW